MSWTADPTAHWEDLEVWLSIMTDNLQPQAANDLWHQNQQQLQQHQQHQQTDDTHPSQSYPHNELAKIMSSIAQNLIAQLKLSDKKAAHCERDSENLKWQTAELQKELTQAQDHISQLETEVQTRFEGAEEIVRVKCGNKET